VRNKIWAAIAASGVVLGAAYMLYLYQRTMFGKIDNPKNEKLPDLNARELATFAPLIVLAVWIGIYPKPFIDRLNTSVNRVIARVSPQYLPAMAEVCGSAPTPEMIAANPAARFLSAVPCGPDGKPLDAVPASASPAQTAPPPVEVPR
jgi:NADH-quinone oxidoreductase subunit M